MQRIFVLMLMLSLFACAPSSAGTIPPGTIPLGIVEQPAMIVLPLGDSITLGNSANGGYRLPLQQMLAADGIATDFIGPETTNSDGMADPEHAGFGGERIDQIEARLSTINDTPDIILLHIGTNDLYQQYQLEGINARLSSLVAALRERWLAARIIVATVGPYTGIASYISHMSEDAVAYNAYIRTLQGVTVADMQLTADMIGDGVHPIKAGYVAMAETWRWLIVKRIWLPWVAK